MQKRDRIVVGIMVVAVLLFFVLLMGDWPSGGGFALESFGSRVALVEIDGQITSSSWAVRQIKHWAEQENVQAIVIRLDSPGGGVTPSQEIFEEIGKARDRGKKVVASMGA